VIPFQKWFQNLASQFLSTERDLKFLLRPEPEARGSATAGSLRALTFSQLPLPQYTSLVMPEASSDMDGSFTNTNPEIQRVKSQLREVLPRLRKEYAVGQLYLHGSRIRGEAGPESDLDILVDFEDSEAGRQISLLDFIALKQELEDVLGMEVDLGERKALRGPAGSAIEKEAETI
jgi:hypothetical protein